MDNPHPKNILIVNVHSTMNAGDAALLWLNIRQFEEAFPGAKFTALVNYPAEPFDALEPKLEVFASPYAIANAGSSQSSLVRLIKIMAGSIQTVIGLLLPVKFLEKRKSPWLRLTWVYRSTDIIAAVSGAQLVSLGRFGWPLMVSSIPLLFAHLFKKPLYIMPQSIGPFRWGWERWLVKVLYSRARLVFMRDNVSLRLSKVIGIPTRKVIFASDPGFALPAAAKERALQLLANYGYTPHQPAIGLTTIRKMSKSFDQSKFDNYYQTMASTLNEFAHRYGNKVYIFNQVTGPTQMEDDRLAAKILLSEIGQNQDWLVHVDAPMTPMELKACYGLMDMFIASRLHSGIFALSNGIPTMFVGYNPKSKGVLEAAGLDQWLIDLDDFDTQKFWELLNKMWENRQSIIDEIQPAIRNCQLDFSKVTHLITEDYLSAGKS